MTTYRIVPCGFPHSFLLDAESVPRARLRGAIYIATNPVLGTIDGEIRVEPWDRSVDDCEYVPAEYFDRLEEPLRRLFEESKP